MKLRRVKLLQFQKIKNYNYEIFTTNFVKVEKQK
jgi:hypothetical protein